MSDYKPNGFPVKFEDGFTISMQGSRTHYSSPRVDYPPFGYTELELGMPNRKCETIVEHAEGGLEWDDDLEEYVQGEIDYTKVIYPYVPLKDILKMMQKHGKILGGDLPPLNTLNLTQRVFIFIYEESLNIVLLSDIYNKWQMEFPLQNTADQFDAYVSAQIVEAELREVTIKSVVEFCKIFQQEVLNKR